MKRYTDQQLEQMYEKEKENKKKAHLVVIGGFAILFCTGFPLTMICGILTRNASMGTYHMMNMMRLILMVIPAGILLFIIKNKEKIFSGGMFQFTDVLHDLLIPYCTKDVFGEDANYSKKQGISEQMVASSHLVGSDWNRFYSNNLVEGNYLGLSFVQSDVKLVKRTTYTDSDGRTRTKNITVFQGPWAVIDFKKQFSTNLIVRERSKNFVDKWSDGKSNVEMENVAFNEKFVVIAESDHEAFYLLTPQMMEHIMQTERRFMGKIYFCFMDGKIHIAIDNGKNCFSGISMDEGAAKARTEIYGRLSLVPELMKQMELKD